MAGEKHILVYIVRHGTTDLNVANQFRGPIDAPLDAKGREDANRLGFYFEPIELAAIFHSDKQRTRDTAEAIAKRKPGIQVFANRDLRAFDVGDLGGKPKNKANLAIVASHVKHPDDTMPGGESLNHFKHRLRPLITDAIDTAKRVGLPVLLVTHSSILREVGSMLDQNEEYTLVRPGGVAGIYIQDGKLDAEPIFKPRAKSDDPHALKEL